MSKKSAIYAAVSGPLRGCQRVRPARRGRPARRYAAAESSTHDGHVWACMFCRPARQLPPPSDIVAWSTAQSLPASTVPARSTGHLYGAPWVYGGAGAPAATELVDPPPMRVQAAVVPPRRRQAGKSRCGCAAPGDRIGDLR